jgi:chromosome segregation ATPase
MSKAAKRSLLILIVLLLFALGFAAITVLEKQKVEEEKAMVEREYAQAQDQFQASEQKHLQNEQQLNSALKSANDERSALSQRIKDVEKDAEEQIAALSSAVDEVTADRDKWKQRIETIRQERDALMTKINDLTKNLEEKTQALAAATATPKEEPKPVIPSYVDVAQAPAYMPQTGKVVDEEFWANLVKQKASLEIDIAKLKDELSAKSVQIVELKQSNEDLTLQVNTLKHEKEGIEVEIQHKSDMIDNISLELARTKNDKKFIADRAEKLNTENTNLRQQMKQLVTVKNALEKSIVRLSQEKDKVQGKLGKTETMIQSKIDEIWEIKDDLDRSIRSASTDAPSSEVELPPIVVSSNGDAVSYNTGEIPGFNGRVISVNDANNFVIVDIGENKGVRLGDSLSVYRDSKYIARLEVIQVRKDIAAADLKDQWSKVQVGDIIR